MNSMKDKILKVLKKLPYFLGSLLSIVGGISAIGMSLVVHEWAIAIGSLCVCGAAVPTVVEWVKKLIA